MQRSVVTEWLMLGLFLLTLGAYVGASLFQDYEDAHSLAQERIASQAKTVGAAVDNQLRSVNGALASIISDFAYLKAQKNGAEIAQRQLKTLTESVDSLRTLNILDADGSVVASSRKELIGYNFRNRDYFQEILRNPDPSMLYVSAPFTTTLGTYAVLLLRMVPGPDGRMAGAVSATLDTEEIRNLLEAMRYTPEITLGIVHAGGKPLLFVPEPAGMKNMNLARPGTFMTRHLQSGQKTSVISGQSQILGSERIAVLYSAQPEGLPMSAPLVVSSSRLIKDVFDPWRRSLYTHATLYLALGLTVALALYLLQRRRLAFDRLKRSHQTQEQQAADQAAAELHASEARYRLLAENMADVLWTMDLETQRFTYVSPSVERLRGYTAEEAMAQPLEASLTPHSLAQVQARIAQRARAFLSGDPAAVTETDELELACKDGSSVWTEVKSTYLKNEQGGITVLAVTRDISRRRQAEQALQSSHAFNLGVLDSLAEHVVVVDKQGHIIAVNESWQRFARDNDASAATVHATGLNYLEVCAQAPAHAFSEVAGAAKRGILAVLASERLEFHLEYPCHSPQEQRWFCMHVTKLRGSQPGAVIAHENITARKLAEIEIRRLNDELEHRVALRTEQLQSANAELQQFAYVASHDLQEPLRMVTSYVQLLEKRLADKLDPDTREFMGFAIDGALRMQKLIQDILAYSRVGSRGQPPVAVDSARALQEALTLLESQITDTGAKIEAQSLPTVTADRTQLAQLFQNLIGNAIKFCPDRAPRVRVEARHEAGEHGPRWRFSVSDNGIGIDPAFRERIFVMFQRLHTRREFPGTGIGLAICKRIVERHGGEIGVEAAEGGGSRFWFTLPDKPVA
jgi:PAS domain S-box-containing protein